jgi:competence protein ComFC
VKTAPFLRKSFETLLSLFYPPHCANCGADTAAGIHLCESCDKGASRIVAPFCEHCSEPFSGAIDGAFVCSNCGGRPSHFECAVACFQSKGVVREFIHRFKYQQQFYLRHPLADWLAETLEDDRISAHPFDAFVPVPLHPARLRERNFNQAEVLARLLSRRAGKPLWPAIRRIRYTTTQTRFERKERMENLRNAFRVRHTALVHSRHLILVDDVFTTGSTVDECARVLREAGAASVRVVTVARG